MKVLVTGGAGYIGSHTCVELLGAGHEVVIVDDLSNSEAGVVERVAQLGGRAVEFVEADIRDRAAMAAVFGAHAFDAVIHFAGLKAVGESVSQPLRYYHNNVTGTIHLLEAMAAGCAPVVSSLACFQDFITPGENGLVFNHRAPSPSEALSQTLSRILPDTASTARIRQAAWTTARGYTLPRIAGLFLDDFQKLCAARSR